MSKYTFKLYVSGGTQACTEAAANIQNICEAYMQGEYELEIVDIGLNPDIAEEEGIMAIPTLIKMEPLPRIRLIGALNKTSRVLVGLGLSENHSE
jgi:circadian clock protein KaiB